MTAVFQSSPAPRDGRYAAEREQMRLEEVSILARPEGRALPKRSCTKTSSKSFQSSPAPRDGRYHSLRGLFEGVTGFNPRPPRGTGATQKIAAVTFGLFVSILARPEGRALPKANHRRIDSERFQSSPAPRDGRYLFTPIHASAHILFQSSPAPRDGRYPAMLGISPYETSFNPRPPRGTGATELAQVEA